MIKFYVVLLLFPFLAVSVGAQENPAIDKEYIILKTGNKKVALGNIKRGDYNFKNKVYDEALSYYLKLYQHVTDHSPLNYKIGVSALYGTNPQKALHYLLAVTPETAADYYLQLGKAYQENRIYQKASEAYNSYIEALPLSQKKMVADEVRQLMSECEFARTMANDSLPVFIINLGPNVNSFYDEYAAVVLRNDSTLFFTSRRPEKDQQKGANPSAFKERIFFSAWPGDGKTTEALELTKLYSTRNMSVAGIDNQNSTLFYYKGKKKQGNIHMAAFDNNKITKRKSLRGRVNTKAYQETTMTVSDSGVGYFISKRRNGVGEKDIWQVQRKKTNRYTKPQLLTETINTVHNEEAVYVTPDGNTLYFSSNGHPGLGGYDIYRVDKDESGNWGKPVNLGYPINSPGDDLFYHPTADSMMSILATKRQGGFGGLDLYLIKKDPRIPFTLKGAVTDSKTGKTLPALVTLFSNVDQLPAGSAYVDTLAGSYNLAMDDGGDLYLQVDAPGYRSIIEPFNCPKTRHKVVEKHFSLEKLLFPYTLSGTITNERNGSPVQAEIVFRTLTGDSVAYRVVSNAETGYYAITFEDKTNLQMEVIASDYYGYQQNLMLSNEEASSGEKNIALRRSITTYTITGVVREEETPAKLQAMIKIYLPDDQAPIAADTTSATDGKYEINLDNAGPFLMEVTAEGYFFRNRALQFHPDTTLMVQNFELQKIKTGARIVIANILFNTGNATLRAESYAELNKLAALLHENPQVRIEVSGHTDNTGSAAVNKRLSRSRALSVRNYLVSQGISGDRVDFEGYGFDRPIAPNETEEGRAANRRVEIEVLE